MRRARWALRRSLGIAARLSWWVWGSGALAFSWITVYLYSYRKIEEETAMTVPPPPAAPPPARLLDQVRDKLRKLHYSPRTEEASVGWIKRYI